jgi:hypothetical protein
MPPLGQEPWVPPSNKILADLKPEAAYFFADDSGHRSGSIVFDMKDTSEIPAVAEPWFLAFNAKVSLRPIMNPQDLAKAGPSIGKAARNTKVKTHLGQSRWRRCSVDSVGIASGVPLGMVCPGAPGNESYGIPADVLTPVLAKVEQMTQSTQWSASSEFVLSRLPTIAA